MNKNKYFLIFILMVGFLLRLLPLDFPLFTKDEARIAVRGYTLAKFGTDELGRKFPYIFNSSEDYKLPLISYLTAGGISLFGKNDLGSRLPFILLGTFLIFFIYKLSKNFSKDEKFSLYAALITCFSPGLIFFSKIPNEFIVAASLLTILMVLLLSEKINNLLILLTVCLMFLTTKIFWFTIIPIIFFTHYFNKKRGNKLFIWISIVILNFFIVVLFIKIPQGVRSLVENNFSTINDITVKNGVERLRSQHLSYWPIILDKVLFSKVHSLGAAFFNLFSHFQPGILFGQLDRNGNYGFLDSGIFPKIVIVPFFAGLIKIIQSQKNKFTYLLIFILLSCFPLLFLYPDFNIGYIIAVLPLIILIVSLGFMKTSSNVSYLILLFIVVEVFVNYLFVSSSIKNSVTLRPFWIKQVVNDVYNISLNNEQSSSANKVYVSDNSVSGLLLFIEWYTPIETKTHYYDVDFPYKFYEGEISNIKTIGESNKFVDCRFEETINIFGTKRDIEKISSIDKVLPTNVYKNDLGVEILYLVKTNKCII